MTNNKPLIFGAYVIVLSSLAAVLILDCDMGILVGLAAFFVGMSEAHVKGAVTPLLFATGGVIVVGGLVASYVDPGTKKPTKQRRKKKKRN